MQLNYDFVIYAVTYHHPIKKINVHKNKKRNEESFLLLYVYS